MNSVGSFFKNRLRICIAHLGAERLRRLQHVEELRVVDLKQHAGDLSCKTQVHVLDEGKETLTCAG